MAMVRLLKDDCKMIVGNHEMIVRWLYGDHKIILRQLLENLKMIIVNHKMIVVCKACNVVWSNFAALVETQNFSAPNFVG